MISAVWRVGGTIIVWSTVLLLVLLPALLGSLASIISVLLALLLLPLLLNGAARRGIWQQPAMSIFILVFCAMLGCYALTARDPGNMLYGSALLALPLAPLVYVAMPGWGVEKPALLLAALCVAGTVISALVAANSAFLVGSERAVGFLMGPNVLARIALLLAFLGLSGLLLTQSPLRYLFYLGPLSAAFVLVLTGTRGAVLALPVMAAILAGLLLTDVRERKHVLALVGLSIAGGVLVLLNSSRFDALWSVLSDVLSGAASSDGATSERLRMLEGAWGAFLHSPWIGYGWANFKPAAALAMDMTPYGTEPGGAFQFHNDFANFAVAAGVIGILALVAILVAPVVGVLIGPRDRYFRARLYCCLQLSVSYLVFGLTDFTLGYDLPTTLYAFLTAMILGGFRERPAA
ncbi:MAG: O-antigen ligase family protein [Roseiflexaceae bacterium]